MDSFENLLENETFVNFPELFKKAPVLKSLRLKFFLCIRKSAKVA
jgi:hypothetical protein